MKKIIAMLLVLAMVIGWITIPPVHVHAEEATEPVQDMQSYLNFVLNEDGASYSVGANTEMAFPYVEVLEIPAEYEGLPVTGIYDRAFFYNGDFGTVEIPEGVTYIGESAFAGRSNLRSITFPDSLTTIGMRAFANCSYLNSVSFGAGIATIGKEAFSGAKAITYVNITDLAGWCKVSFASSTSNPLQCLQMVLTDGVPTRGLCINGELVTKLEIPEGVTQIADYAFYRCPGFFSVTIPESVETIGRNAFAACKPLDTVTIKDGTTEIGGNAFANCTFLTTLYISDSVTKIGEKAFSNCTALKNIYFAGTSDQWNAITIGDGNIDVFASASIFFNGDMVDPSLTFELNEDGQSYSVVACDGMASGIIEIPEAYNGLPVTAIGEEAFKYCTNLENVSIPQSVTSIGRGAFYGCSYLCDIDIPQNVTVIEDMTFSECSALAKVSIPNGVTVISNGAFSNCSNLTQLVIPESVTAIGYDAFSGCAALTEVVIPEGVVAIYDMAFSGCHNLASVTIPSTLRTIPYSAFSACDSLTDVFYNGNESQWNAMDIQSGNECLLNANIHFAEVSDEPEANWEDCLVFEMNPDGASYKVYFCKAKPVGALTIPATYDGLPVTIIGGEAFADCYELTSVKIPDTVTKIVTSAFRNCPNLTQVTLFDSVAEIGSNAFGDCVNLSEVYYVGTQEEWKAIVIAENNDPLINAKIVFAEEDSEPTEPTQPAPSEPPVEPSTAPTEAPVEPSEPSVAPTAPSEVPSEPSEPAADPLSYAVWSDSVAIIDCDENFQGYLEIPAEYEGLPVLTIYDSAFFNCRGLTGIKIPDTVSTIGNTAFSGCSALMEIVIPAGVTHLCNQMLADCTSLTTVTIPASLREIGGEVFVGCTALQTIYYMGTAAQWEKVDIFPSNSEILSNVQIIFSEEEPVEPTDPSIAPSEPPVEPSEPSVAPTETPEEPTVPSMPEVNWEEVLSFELLENGEAYRVKKCDEKATGLLRIPETYNGLPVTHIGYDAFWYCIGLQGVVIPYGVTVIEDYAFGECNNLSYIHLPESLTYIGYRSFSNCYDLYTIQIPDAVYNIDTDAFAGSSVDGIWVGENNQTYTNDEKGILFSKDMTVLYQVPTQFEGSYRIPDGVQEISAYAFSGCGLTEIIFPDSVKYIYNNAFERTRLTRVDIGNGVEVIGQDAFAYIDTLTAVMIPNTVSDMHANIFAQCPVTIYCHIGSLAAMYAAGNAIDISYLDVVKELSVEYLPEKLTYPLDGKLKLDGLTLNVTLEDGTKTVIWCGYTVEEYDFSTAGTKTITVSVGGASTTFEVFVDDQLVEYPESSHPYANNSDITWKYTHITDADALKVTFSDDTRTENNYDFIYICDAEGNEYQYCGKELQGKTITVSGKFFTIRLTSDGSVAEYGFKIVNIAAVQKVDWESALTFELNAQGDAYIVTHCDETAEGSLEIPAVYNGLRVRYIADNAFANCVGLEEIVLPGELLSIGDYAFQYCGNLKEITIPVSVTAIGDYAFLACNALTNVYYGGNRTQWNAIEMGANNDPLPNAQIKFSPEGCNHIPGETEVVDEWGGSGCLENRYQTVVTYCADCGTGMGTHQVIRPATGHTPGEPVAENYFEPGCNYSGHYEKVVRCTECGVSLNSEIVLVEPTGHIPSEMVEEYYRPADCFTEGLRRSYIYCTCCGETLENIVEKIPAKGHTPGEAIVDYYSEPTCNSNGYRWIAVNCVDCYTQLDGELEIIPAKGHTPGEAFITDQAEPDCNSSGYIVRAVECVDCYTWLDMSFEVLPATDHIPSETFVESIETANCTHAGSYWTRVYCQCCGNMLESEKVIVQATGHTPGETLIWNEVSAGCEDMGHYEEAVFCSNENCGVILSRRQVIIPALGHTEETVYGYPATCTQSGVSDGKWCTVCGQTTVYQEEIPALGHTAKEPVVENEFDNHYDLVVYCENCNEELSRETIALGCKHTDVVTETQTIPATCVEPGAVIETYICAACGEELGGDVDEIPALGHTEEMIPGKEPTETETGLTEGKKCSVCGEILVKQEEIPATGPVIKDYPVATMDGAKPVFNLGTAQKLTRVYVFYVDGVEIADIQNWNQLKAAAAAVEVSPYNGSYLDCNTQAKIDALELPKNGTYVLRMTYTNAAGQSKTLSQQVEVNVERLPSAELEGTKLVFDENYGTTLIQDLHIFYLGDIEVEDIQNWSQLVAASQAAANNPFGSAGYKTVRGDALKQVVLSAQGRYVLRMVYVNEEGVQKTISQEVMAPYVPVASLDEADVIMNENNGITPVKRVYVFYVGETAIQDINDWYEIVEAGKLYTDINGSNGYKIYEATQLDQIQLPVKGNYVLRIAYEDTADNNAEKVITQQLTVDFTVSLVNGIVRFDKMETVRIEQVHVFYVGDSEIQNVNDWYELKAIGALYTKTEQNGPNGYRSFKNDKVTQVAPRSSGNYVLRIEYYVNVDGKEVKYTLSKRFTLEMGPLVGMAEDGKLTVDTRKTYTIDTITVFYVGDQVVANPTYSNLKKAATGIEGSPYGESGYKAMRDMESITNEALTVAGNYVLRVSYKTADGTEYMMIVEFNV